MKINDIKNLQQLDVIAKNLTENELDIPVYEIYYVLFNFKKRNKIEVCQGYYEYNTNRNIFLEYTRQDVDYDEVLLYFELIHKAGE